VPLSNARAKEKCDSLVLSRNKSYSGNSLFNDTNGTKHTKRKTGFVFVSVFIPRVFAEVAARDFPDAVTVNDQSPGDSPQAAAGDSGTTARGGGHTSSDYIFGYC